MEEIVERLFPDYVIIRTSNIIGHNPWNPHTLFNYLYLALKEEKKITVVESASRNMLDVAHFMKMLDHYLLHYKKQRSTVNIVNARSYQMAEILSAFENFFGVKFVKDHGKISIAKFQAPCTFSGKLMKECGIGLENYLQQVIEKYYPPFKKSLQG